MHVTPAEADLVKQYATDTAATLKALAAVGQMVPAGRTRHDRDPAQRRDAYIAFQATAWDAFSWTVYFTTLADFTRKPLLRGGVYVPTRRLIDDLGAARAANSAFLGACSAIRLVGNPEPRAAAEQITAIVSELFDTMPTTGSDAERAEKAATFAKWRRAFGEAHKDFTLICRRDLSYAPTLREHWWQLWRPRHEEDWPGGWPVPPAQLLEESE